MRSAGWRRRTSARRGEMTSPRSLSVVIPVYNEGESVIATVDAAVAALERAPFDPVEIVIVDDGSESSTQKILGKLRAPMPLRVIRQENLGRFGARRTGVESARGEVILLLDTRVILEPDALVFVGAQIGESASECPAWNGHVEIDVEGNPYARFWRTVTAVAWRAYFNNPRTTRFGADEYDRYPKGTGCFVASRATLLQSMQDFQTHFGDLRDANDDTILLRPIAERQGINISPSFSCVYRSRTSFVPFLRHAYHRGTHFFDGFARSGTRYGPALGAFFPLSAGAVVVACRRPAAGMALAMVAPISAAAGAAVARRPRGDVVAFAALAPPFTIAFGAGIWRGAFLAARFRLVKARRDPRPQSPEASA
jgi:glycosyltransferase involved in cell wall biosynthesis